MEESSPLKISPEFYNELKWTPCSLGRACSFLMMPFVFGIMGLTYVPYVAHFGDGSFKGGLCLFIFHILLLLTVTAYLQVVVSSLCLVEAGSLLEFIIVVGD